jgi:prepilin-type processing-associated H-X9-DG protein
MQIGQMCQLYANENQDHLLDNLGILTTAEDMVPEALQSPLSGQSPPSPPSTQPAVLVPWANQHCDYTYLGAGKSASQLTPTDILGHEKWSIAKLHGGMNILFGDGHVEWFILADAAKILGQNPSTAQTP